MHNYIILSLLLISCKEAKYQIVEEVIPIDIKIDLINKLTTNNNQFFPTEPQINIEDLPIECSKEMNRIDGLYCTDLRHKCSKKIDNKRCKLFDKEATICKGKELKLSFCMDREEYTTSKSKIPVHNVTWTTAFNTCKYLGKRLCTEYEWNLACEGPERTPYSYGWERDSKICNIDILKVGRVGHLIDHTKSIDEFPDCKSQYGIHGINGNVDEWIVKSKKYSQPILSGGWWGPVRNACRPKTTEHGKSYQDVQTGIRCCSD